MPKRLTPAERLQRDLDARGLMLPDALRRELLAACHTPAFHVHVLRERLAVGGAVLDERGGMEAPDALWDRWEGIFAAWCVLDEEVSRVVEAARKRMRRGYGGMEWQTEQGQRQTEPRLTGLGKRKTEKGPRT